MLLGQINLRIIAIAAAAVITTYLYTGTSDTQVLTNNACDTQTQYLNDDIQCSPQAHQSWYAWLTGESSNAQFHYLDLLELLIGSNKSADNGRYSQPFNQ